MTKKLFVLIFLIIPLSLVAQNRAKMKYYFPDTVEIVINGFIESQLPLKKGEVFYFQLEKDTGVYKLFLNRTNKSLSNSWWIQSTNRVAVVVSHLIPLIFDYDEIFSTDAIQVVGSPGKRDGEIKKVKSIYHVPEIYFDQYGKIIRPVGIEHIP